VRTILSGAAEKDAGSRPAGLIESRARVQRRASGRNDAGAADPHPLTGDQPIGALPGRSKRARVEQ